MRDAAARIAAARSFLFVPGDRPDRFGKAWAAGADVVILDLEDAVPIAAKAAARQAVAAWLSPERPVLVRINAEDSDDFEADLALCGQGGLLGVMLPKAEAGTTLARVAALAPTVALIESARGVATVQAVAATPGVVRLAFGTIDLSLDLGVDPLPAVLDPIALSLVIASRAAGIAAPIDGVTPDFRDPAGIAAAARKARSFGFGGTLCIHPAQLAPGADAYRPSTAEIALAERIIAADRAAAGRAVALDGRMIDRPIVERARRTLGLVQATA